MGKLSLQVNNLWVQKYSLGPTRREVSKIIIPLLDERPELKILDIGCGTGQILNEVSSTHPMVDYLGIDVANNMIELAKENNKGANIKFIVSSIEDFKSDGKFDIILCTHAFPYFPNKEEMLKKMANLCNEKGELIIVNSSSNSLKDLVINFFLKATTSEAKYLSIGEMKELFERAGLKLKKINIIREKVICQLFLYFIWKAS
ncbi:MAG: methyltransferase domain-containing protein [Tissierellia bacterium]|nr:methyltransferase domain-containing protein [Tissierellia bacterium]